MLQYLVYWPDGRVLLVGADRWLTLEEVRFMVAVQLEDMGLNKALAETFVRVDIAFPPQG